MLSSRGSKADVATSGIPGVAKPVLSLSKGHRVPRKDNLLVVRRRWSHELFRHDLRGPREISPFLDVGLEILLEHGGRVGRGLVAAGQKKFA